MTEICSFDTCTACGACLQICPTKCIVMKENDEGFMYPYIDKDRCVDCKKCIRTCPVINENAGFKKAQFYMAWHKDRNVLKHSSSGGVFTALAEYVLSRGGVVIGAELDKTSRRVNHISIENIAGLDRLRFSKYYQSDTGDVYNETANYLRNGRYVLFSGTSCQIAGLYTVLGDMKDNGRLITVDVLCHGVASKKVIDAYIKSKEKRYKKKIKNYFFRTKCEDARWKSGGGMKLEFEDGSTLVTDKPVDTFFIGFNCCAFLRESCYKCRYCGTERLADFTIADFWGVTEERVSKEQMEDGVSLMLVNTGKAKKILGELRGGLVYEEILPEEAIPYNLALTRPNARPPQRDTFFDDLRSCDYDKLIKKYFYKTYINNLIRKNIKQGIGERNYRRLKIIKNIIKGK